jgi:predicted nucleic acid-binding protein
MPVVVADTSPLNYLILIEAIDLLSQLYGRIVIPVEVLNELIDALYLFDRGERCAILLAELEAEALLLIDETAGRLEASRRGIPNTGTVGIIRAASLLG